MLLFVLVYSDEDNSFGAMTEFDQTFVTDLVGHIYEAAVDAAHWDEFLATLETAFPDSRITLFGHENGRPCAELTRRCIFCRR